MRSFEFLSKGDEHAAGGGKEGGTEREGGKERERERTKLVSSTPSHLIPF